MPEETKIYYDISDAISKLNILNEKLGEVGDKTVETFQGAASQALDGFIDMVGDLSPTMARGATAVRNLAAAFGPMGLVVGTAAAGLASVAASLVNMPELLADNEAGVIALTDAMQRQFEISEQIGDINEAFVRSDFRTKLREISLEQGKIAEKKAANDEKLAGTDRTLVLLKRQLAEEERLVKASVDRQKKLRDKLNEGKDEAFVKSVEAGGRTQERAVGELAAAASQAAMKGNVELAEKLRDRAQEIADELGGHVFYQKQIDAATGQIQGKLQRQLAEEKRIGEAAKGAADNTKERINLIEEEVALLRERNQLLSADAKRLRAQRRGLGEQLTQFNQQDKSDTAAGIISLNIKKAEAEFVFGARSFWKNAKDSLRVSASNLLGGANQDAGFRQLGGAAFAQAGNILERLQDPNLSVEDIQKLGPEISRLSANVGALKVQLDRGVISEGRRADVEQLDRLVGYFQTIQKGAQGVGEADRGFTDKIRQGMESNVKGLDQAAKDLSNAGKVLSGGKTNVSPTTRVISTEQLQKAGYTQPGPAAASNITVNANVKGGLIDPETTRTITDIIRTELRKQTINKTQ